MSWKIFSGSSCSTTAINPSISAAGSSIRAASPLPPETARPMGTPGKKNLSFSAVLPPTIRITSEIVDDAAPKQPLKIEAEAKDPAAIVNLTLLYRTIADGVEGKETSLPMARDGARFSATIPGQTASTLVRYRIKLEADGATRFY